MNRVCVGQVVGAQGLRGAVRVKSFTAEPESVAAYGPVEDEAGRRWPIRIIGRTGTRADGALIAALGGIEDRNAAEALKGTRLYVPRAALPATEAEEFYHADLIGLAAVETDGTKLGIVRAVHDFGAGPMLEVGLEVEAETGASVMIPFTAAAVPVIDIAAGRLVVDPPKEAG